LILYSDSTEKTPPPDAGKYVRLGIVVAIGLVILAIVGNQGVILSMNFSEFGEQFTKPLYYSVISAVILSAIVLVRVNIVARSSIFWYGINTGISFLGQSSRDPIDPSLTTVWGDLAIVDNESSSDQAGLWQFWTDLVLRYLDLGFHGFRCDAAYQIPAELWRVLIHEARKVNPNAVFWAENLGCTPEQTRALRAAGFQFFCNSSKWWNFQDAWCLEQHREFEDVPSISFPETHDTDRLAQDTNGLEMIQRQRYAFAATFSAGVMMPIGYEFGFQKKLHVVDTQPSDWEAGTMDVQQFVQAVNEAKLNTPLLQGEGTLNWVPVSHPSLLLLSRESEYAPGQTVWAIRGDASASCGRC